MKTAPGVTTVALGIALACAGPGTASSEEPRKVRAGQPTDPSGPGRDPFASPRRELPDSPPAAREPADSLEGVSIDELAVRGVLLARDRSVAIVQGTGTRYYFARPGDRLRDGRIQAVEVTGVVMVADAGRARGGEGTGVLRKPVRGPRSAR